MSTRPSIKKGKLTRVRAACGAERCILEEWQRIASALPMRHPVRCSHPVGRHCGLRWVPAVENGLCARSGRRSGSSGSLLKLRHAQKHISGQLWCCCQRLPRLCRLGQQEVPVPVDAPAWRVHKLTVEVIPSCRSAAEGTAAEGTGLLLKFVDAGALLNDRFVHENGEAFGG